MRQNSEIRGVIFDIQSFSVHDGPGIRTLIFLKGCPLGCKWCSNPESRHPKHQLLYKKDLCQPQCGKCKDDSGVVRNAGRVITGPGQIPCCHNNATEVCGKTISITEVMAHIQKDRPYYGDKGGITLSGGEPFFQPGFTLAILQSCRRSGISTAIETSLYAPFPVIEEALPFIGFFMFDIKFVDPVKHREYCGVDNKIILDNIRELARVAEVPLLPRLPLIPGINDDDENILKTAEFLSTNELRNINLLPYMRLGIGKYEQLGLEYELSFLQPPAKEKIERIKKLFYRCDIFCM